jgi:ribosome-associated protein
LPGETDFLKSLVLTSLDDDKAENVVVVDLGGKTSFADLMVVATGRSQRHVASMADHIAEKLRSVGHTRAHIEGKEACNWVLLDAGDIIVHLFRPEIRELYNLEKMWAVAAPSRELAL